MSTKAEDFKADQQRKRHRRPALPKIPPPGLVIDTSRAGTSATMRRKGGASTAARNRAAHAARKAAFALEDSLAPARPTRKSTRKSANRSKAESNLARRQKRRDRAPENRSAKAALRARIPPGRPT